MFFALGLYHLAKFSASGFDHDHVCALKNRKIEALEARL